MIEESREQLLTYFETGDIPTEDEFSNLISSYVHRLDDGVTVYDTGGTGGELRFGIGTTTPSSRLGILAEGSDERLLSLHRTDSETVWYFNQNPIVGTLEFPGFNIAKVDPAGDLSGLFISEASQKVGMGTLNPVRKLHIEASNPSGATAMRLTNIAATATSNGWSIGHLHDGSITERSGALAIAEEDLGGAESGTERMVILQDGNVGIGEPIPKSTLHVTRLLSDPDEQIDLTEDSGVITVGADIQNVKLDSHGMQALSGEYAVTGGALSVDVNNLRLQYLGGGLTVHGSLAPTNQVVITGDAHMGVGIDAPIERAEFDGAIRIGVDTGTGTNAGTIRWDGLDFEGYDGANWLSLTAGGGKWLDNTGGDSIYFDVTDGKVGIGTNTPQCQLDIQREDEVDFGSVSQCIENTSNTLSAGSDDHRVGIEIDIHDSWGGSDTAKSVGLWVSEVSGSANNRVNIAAALNGNVVIGDLPTGGAHVLGTDARNVLSIQKGTAPATDVETESVQVYADDLGTGLTVFHVMSDDGKVVKLYENDALETAVAVATGDINTGDATTDIIVQNLVDRINDLEDRMKDFGLLPA